MHTSLVDNFNSPQGEFVDYDSYDSDIRTILYNQKHVDIRALIEQENWTTDGDPDDFDIGTLDILNYWNAILVEVPALDAVVLSSFDDRKVDLITGFDDESLVTCSCYNFPVNLVDPSATYLELTSNADGDFTEGPTDRVYFANSLGQPTIINPADTAEIHDFTFSWPRTSFETIDLEEVTGVRIGITNLHATEPLSFCASALRLVSPTWQHLSLDINTVTERIQNPSAAGSGGSITLPVIWRSSGVVPSNVFKPIDVELTTIFNMGSRTQDGNVALYVRESILDRQDQADLGSMTMADLAALGQQPDYGSPVWDIRTQEDLGHFTQGELQGQTQQEISQIVDETSASYIVFQVDWTDSDAAVTIGDADSTYFTQDVTLTENTDYMFVAEIEDHKARIQIFSLANNMAILDEVYDSGYIVDDFLFNRVRGRIGWSATLADGDAYVDRFNPRSLNFAEYRTSHYESITPIEGARLFVEASADDELFTGITTTEEGVTLSEDEAKSVSGLSTRILIDGQISSGLAGIRTNVMELDDFVNTTLSFSLYHEDLSNYDGLVVELVRADLSGSWDTHTQEYLNQLTQTELNTQTQYELSRDSFEYRIPIQTGLILEGQWETIHIPLTALRDVPPGQYFLEFLVDTDGRSTTFWIDRIHVRRRTIEWAARALDHEDPWGDHNPEWVNFGQVINSQQAGVLFPEQGNILQVRGRALSPDAFIRRIRVLPKYAELGRLIWIDDPEEYTPITATTTITPITGRTYRFQGASAADIINYHWYFGDGVEGDGQSITHTYEDAGNYVVGLTATDRNGKHGFDQDTLNVA